MFAAACGEDEPAGLRPVGDDGFEVATDELRLLVDHGAVFIAGHGDPTLVFDSARFERAGVGARHADLGRLSLEANRANYSRGELGEEWFELRESEALEQGWSLTDPPGAPRDGRLEVVLDLGPDVEIIRESDEQVAVGVRDGEVTYSNPVAHDANGTPLLATLATRDRAIVLTIDDSTATYPIEIDPLTTLTPALLEPPVGATPEYGFAVAIDGNNLFIGQPDLPRDVTNGLMEGAVHQFTKVSGVWQHSQRIRVVGTSATAAFGSAVDVHGNWLVVGAPGDMGSGRVHAIRFVAGFGANGVPITVQAIAPPVSPLYTFGGAVSISGARLAIGGALTNQVFVYNVSGTTWSNTAAHRIAVTMGNFGNSVDLARSNANLLVVGAPSLSTNGRVHMYRWDGVGWGTASVISPLSSPSQQTKFGVSVAVSGSANAEHVAIGCLSSSGTRAQLARTIYSGSSWGTPTVQISGAMSGYLSTAEPFLYNTDNQTPHVAIAPDSSSAGNDILMLGLPNGVVSSAGTGAVVGTHIALPAGLSAAQKLLPGGDGVIHRGRSVATDGATLAVGDQNEPWPDTTPGDGYVGVRRVAWANGTSCTLATAAQCASGLCIDDVCCNSACGGAGVYDDCQACSAARGASVNGTCGALTASFAPTITCRAGNVSCDVAETCVAGSTTCPANIFRPSSHQCGTSTGGCDANDFCSGSSATCTNSFQPNGYVCRGAAAGSCDRAETCSGSSATCPTDAAQPMGTACGSDTSDPCDAADVCNGVSFACPELSAPLNTLCRPAVSPCDAAETCSGSSITCPANAPARPAGTLCRAANPSLGCDANDVCNGVAHTCPVDAPALAGTLCRGAAGVCDVSESCDGTSFGCPTDVVQDPFTLCRVASNATPPGASECDVPEYCDGSSAGCPADIGGLFGECCVASEWADGQQCRTDYLCVDSSCTERGCGDGWLEAPERCDDGNAAGGDACSATCDAPAAFVIAGRTDQIDEPSGDRSVAVDGGGRVLVVWSERNATSTRIRARRYTAYGGNPSGAVSITEVASLPGPGWDASPVVTALASGWAIAWRQPAGAEVSAVVAARMSATGALGAPIRVSGVAETLPEHPGIAALSNGSLLVTWTDATAPTSPIVRYRWIVGSAVSGDPMAIASGAGGDAVVAAVGTTAMVVWTEEPALGARPRVLARRLTSTTMIDADPLVIATNASQATVSASNSHFAVGWVGRQDDPQGDIFAIVVPLANAITASAGHVTDVADPDRAHAERAPSILAHGTGWIIGWEVPTQRSARIVAGPGVVPPPELASILSLDLTDVLASDLSFASSARGTWVVWSSAYEPTTGAARATWGFLLPPPT